MQLRAKSLAMVQVQSHPEDADSASFRRVGPGHQAVELVLGLLIPVHHGELKLCRRSQNPSLQDQVIFRLRPVGVAWDWASKSWKIPFGVWSLLFQV